MAKIAGFTTNHRVDQFLSKDMLDKQARRQLTQFMEQVELTVFQANKEVLRREIPNLDRDSFIRFAVQVAEARARYVKHGLEITKAGHRANAAELDQLKGLRLAYDELLAAFEATQRLIERGYASINLGK
jgi:cell division protein FtsB